ncbi:MAG: ribonuclease [Lachnospiraceae bacterium]|nr:ribonuclease [Lachnospiraceae bacterium]
MNIDVIMQYITYGLAMLGILAFIVSIVVQVIKELPGLTKLPTSVVALVASLILCPVALIVLCSYYKIVVTWYYVFASFIAAFIVYLVSTGGWDKLKAIWDRTKYKKMEGE